jgi:hypothetical protein
MIIILKEIIIYKEYSTHIRILVYKAQTIKRNIWQ